MKFLKYNTTKTIKITNVKRIMDAHPRPTGAGGEEAVLGAPAGAGGEKKVFKYNTTNHEDHEFQKD
jgi:hypothetical protein